MIAGRKLCIVAALVWLAPATASASATRWPEISPSAATFAINIGEHPVVIEKIITSKSGTALYRFSCRAGTTAQLDALGDAEGENYVAPMVCGSGEPHGRGVGTLLLEDDSAPWYSRGQVHLEELAGACGRYPEFGRVRHFRLRGMVLTIALSKVVLDREGLVRATLSLTALPDAGATTAQAERPGYLPPKEGCAEVVKGVEPRMCRDGSFGWAECGKIGR